MFSNSTKVSTLLIFAFTAGAAQAGPLTAQEIIQQFNLVVAGDIKSTSHVDGRTYAGGSVSGGDYVQHPNDVATSAYAGLTAGGSVSNVNVNGKGAYVGGSLSNSNINSGSAVVKGAAANVNFNGGPAYVAGAAAANFNGGRVTNLNSSAALKSMSDAATSTNFLSVLNGLSDDLSHLASTGSNVTISGNKATFNAVANASGLAVFDLTQIDTALFKMAEFAFNLNGASTVIFNTDDSSYDINANFLGGSAALLGTKAIWNFYNAEDIKLTSQFGGVILATDANLNNTQNIEGTVLVENLKQQGEIHLQKFSGTIPAFGTSSNTVSEPDSLMLVLLALGLGPVLRYRQRRWARAPGIRLTAR